MKKKMKNIRVLGIITALAMSTYLTGCADEEVKLKDINLKEEAVIETTAANDNVQEKTLPVENMVNQDNQAESKGDFDLSTKENNITESKYKIEGDNVPIPNANCFKSPGYENVSEITAIIEKARKDGLLGQNEKVVFNENANFLNWGGVHYYYDESILVIVWKEIIDEKYMTFAEVKIADPTQFRRKLADDTFGSKNQYLCSELSKQVNGVISMNADYYAYRSLGTVVYNGKVCRDETSLNTLFIDCNGDFIYCDNEKDMTKDGLQKFVDEHKVGFSISFGPILVRDGKIMDFKGYPIGEANQDYSRSCLCQVDSLHYLFANAGYISADNQGCTAAQLGKFVFDKGVKEAYTLDGGQTSEVIFNGTIFNPLKPEDERLVSDIIYFATAIPGGN